MNSFDFSKITPAGRLVRLFGSGLVLDITPRSEGLFDIDKIYREDGTVIRWDDPTQRPTAVGNFMDGLYDEVDRGLFSEIQPTRS